MKRILPIILILVLATTVMASKPNKASAAPFANSEMEQNPIIPNAKVAYSVGKILLEEKIGRPLEYATAKGTYYLQVEYHVRDNTWTVSQECDMKHGGYGGSGPATPYISFDKTTGEVKYINEEALIPGWESAGSPIPDFYFIKYIINKNIDINLFGYSTFD